MVLSVFPVHLHRYFEVRKVADDIKTVLTSTHRKPSTNHELSAFPNGFHLKLEAQIY